MSLEFVSTMSLEFIVNYVLDWFSAEALLRLRKQSLRTPDQNLLFGKDWCFETRFD